MTVGQFMIVAYYEDGWPVCGLCNDFIGDPESTCECWCLECKYTRGLCSCNEQFCVSCGQPVDDCDCDGGPYLTQEDLDAEFDDDADYDEIPYEDYSA